ncbi:MULTISPECIES: SdpI family protein [Nonomuraea]|uniref:SdpI family protein n=1 Tax=Nonomuraea ferruginea TaxID=46174 RepID=A0ABT4SRP9_9ACTN|nr:SdpI family protein [Nonomuraea ferruginea]MDA0639946.1 SdpI family protein [Nonomuraea ferruginea]
MGPILINAILTAPALALLLIPFHDESGAVDSRNGLAGLRTRETLASREAWDAAHTWAKVPMRMLAAAMAGVLVVSAAAELAVGLPEGVQVATILAQAGLLIGGLGLIGWRAHRVAARVNRELAGRPA